MSDKLKIVIIDNNRSRRELIVGMLPDYVEPFPCDFGEKAYMQLRPEDDGRRPDAVILAGDDPRSRGLETFVWMRNKTEALKGAFVPVLVLTDDEFSEKSMEFYEVDDVIFYEGEPDEDRFYSALMETLDMTGEEDEYIEEPAFVEKSSMRVMGKRLKAPKTPEGRSMRVAVITNEDSLKSLANVLEKGKEQAAQRKALQAEFGYDYGVNTALLADDDDIPEEFRRGNDEKSEIDAEKAQAEADMKIKLENARRRALQRLENDQSKNSNTEGIDLNKATIVVVDDHEFVRKIFEMTLSDKYNVISIASGMKAIDYFVQNTADLIFMDAVMPGMSGVSAMNSIRWQRNGEKVPCVYLLGNDYSGSASTLSGNYVCGTLPKPVSKGAILTAVEHLKMYIDALR